MRWRLGRDRGGCATCGAELDPDAVWCGSCGAAVAGAREPGETHPAESLEPPDHVPEDDQEAPRWQRFVRVVAVVALAALVIALLRPTPPPEALLGQVGALAGLSATGPPPDGLRVAWEAGRSPGVGTGGFWGRDVVAADGRLRVGDVVVELGSGRVVRHAASDPGWVLPAMRHRVEHTGDELVVVDTLTGEVVTRSPVEVPSGAQLVTRARSGDVTLLSDGLHSFRVEDGDWVAEGGVEDRSLLVRDDGEVLAELGGTMADSDRAVGDPASFPVRRANGEVQLVAAGTGEVVAELTAPPGDLLAVDVVGDLALVATTSGQLPGSETPSVVTGPRVTGVPWMVELVDARTGLTQRQLVMQSAEPPRLLGFLDDGTTVLSTRSGREVAVRGIDPDGQFGPIAQVTTGVGSVIDTPSAGASALLATVGVSGGVAVGLDVRRGLLGFSRQGNVLWQAEAPPDAEVLAAGGGFVAAIPHDQGERVLVVDATDGRVAATISRDDADLRVVNVPFAVLDGHVGMGRTGQTGSADVDIALGTTTWLDLDTGELTAMHDLFAPHAGGEPEDVGANWTLHGVLPVAPGGEPMISSRGTRSVVQVLEPGRGLVTFELPGREGDAGVAAFVPETIGASATRLAVRTRDFEDQTEVATHLINPSSGIITTVPAVAGVALLDDLLLAVAVDETFEVTAILGVDAASGERLWVNDAATGGPLWSGDSDLLRTPAPHRLDRDLLVAAAPLAVEAVSLQDGTRAWLYASDVELSPDHLVLGPAHVMVVATDGEVIALDRDDGAVAWRTSVGAPVASITGAGEHVLVGTHDGLVVHLDGTGREVQRIAVGNDPVLGIAALGDIVVAVVGDAVVALRADGTGITRQDEVELP